MLFKRIKIKMHIRDGLCQYLPLYVEKKNHKNIPNNFLSPFKSPAVFTISCKLNA